MRIILLRHAESLGNIDELAYTRTPDHSLPLTVRGEVQARAAGPTVRALIDGPVAAYVSPYVRAQRTFALLEVPTERVVPEPRLREQDWGNLQDPVEQELENNAATTSATSSTDSPTASRAPTSMTEWRPSSTNWN